MTRCVVLGGGIAGLAAAYALRRGALEMASGRGAPEVKPGQSAPEMTLRLVEAEPRWGGKVLSQRQDGFLLEGGPDSFVPYKPAALRLVRELGLGDQLVPSRDVARGAAIFWQQRLRPLPEGFRQLVPGPLVPFLRSSVLSWPGKLRVAMERWIPKGPAEGDESVAQFVRRRLGSEALERLAEPMLAHIHVADIERMSLESTYPRLRAMEQRFGSLTQGMRSAGAPAAGKPVGPMFWSLKDGIGALTDALHAQLPEPCKILGRRARSLHRQADGSYRIELDNGETLDADAVVLALPAFAAAEVVESLAPSLAEALRTIRYVSLATLSLGYRRSEVAGHPPGFGFFVPRVEQQQVLAATWSSVKFDHRAPDDTTLLRVFLAQKDENDNLLTLPDDELLRRVQQDLRRLTGLRAEPILQRLYRWPKGYPQYDVGHSDTLRSIGNHLPSQIFLAGSAFHGVGLPDCIQSGFAAAKAVLGGVS